MTRTVILAVAALVALSLNAEARPRHRVAEAQPACVESVMRPCNALSPADLKEARRVARGQYIADKLGYGGVADKPFPRARRSRKASEVQSYIGGIVAPLAAKVSEIQTACGSKIISGVRHTRVAGTRLMSLHATGQAVDMAGNPGCIAGHLVNWEGGASNDYARVGHYHISYGGREHGIRFAHGGYRHARRYARHRFYTIVNPHGAA